MINLLLRLMVMVCREAENMQKQVSASHGLTIDHLTTEATQLFISFRHTGTGMLSREFPRKDRLWGGSAGTRRSGSSE